MTEQSINSSVVLASRDVNCQFITAQLKMIQNNASVTRLEVEDFVCSGQVHHAAILPLLQSMLTSSSRRQQCWESIQFVDTLWSLEELAQWQSTKGAMMAAWKVQLPQELVRKVTWNATLHLSTGSASASLLAIHQALQSLKQDQDPQVLNQVSMSGGSTSTAGVGIPLKLQVVSAIGTGRKSQTRELLLAGHSHSQEEEECHCREVGQKSDRPDLFNDSYSSIGTASTEASSTTTTSSNSGSRRRRNRRHRQKRTKSVNVKEQNGTPDYNWKMGSFP